MNTINYVNIWILSLWSISSVMKYAICSSMIGPFILISITPLCWGSILSVDLTAPIVAL